MGLERTNNVSELAEIYSAADVFLNLGKEETMGLTTVEAMACGTPVVVSNMTSIPEVVEGKSGVILNSLEESEIVSGIKDVMTNRYNGMIKNASKYEKEKQYKKYLELFGCL